MSALAPLRPALVLALDGATFSVIEPLVAAGRLPNLARAMREGTHAPLPSVVPPVTFPAWSSFMTGLGPGEHGVFDFTQKLPGRYRIRFANASDRTGRSLFARVCDAGGRVLVLGMPAAFPPEPLDGLLVCGFDAPVSSGTDARSASDPALYERIAARAGPWMRPDLDESARDPGFHERAVGTLLARIERKERFALEALRGLAAQGGRPDLAMIVFSESDTVGHHYWRDHDPASPRHDPAASATRRGAIAAVYQRLDLACGRLRDAFGEEAACFVLSDHGMGGAANTVVHLNRRLEEAGLLVRRRAGGVDAITRRVRDAALRWLPATVAQQLFRRARGAAARVESAVRMGGFDWRQTRAWSEEANTNPGVWINLRGREARGCVAPEAYEATRDAVIDALESWRLPGGTAPVVARARRREELYSGPFVERAPDVAVELALHEGYGLSLVPTPWADTPVSTRTLRPEERGGGRGRGMNGTHRRDGVWIDARGDLPQPPAGLAAAAPAIARVMGVPWAAVTAGDGDGSAVQRDYSAEEDAIVAERLRALGYLE
ncbi:MAG: alkaline phosphatase family protein [Myxococcota bacterium]|nr:alkaline phosphatase family protein [Myxococcota bacterium]